MAPLISNETPGELAGDSADETIFIRGARTHNLKNISVKIPRNSLTVITGPSGSGKSSLAFDTIFAEGQRRYVESLSSYARQFLDQVAKPDVDEILGLSPTISIEQRTTTYNPRSTVGTVTEIYDYLRLLYSRISVAHCYSCGKPILSQSPSQMVDQAVSFQEGTRLNILAPIARERKGEYQKELLQLRSRGFVRVKIDGEVFDLSDDISLEKNKKHSIAVYVDRVIIKKKTEEARAELISRVSTSVETALKLSDGLLLIEALAPGAERAQEHSLSRHFACPSCQISYPEPEPRTFSFNSPMGACPACDGIGYHDPENTGLATETHLAGDVEVEFEKKVCTSCLGSRLKKESLSFHFRDLSIVDLANKNIIELEQFFSSLSLVGRELLIAEKIIKEILSRLAFLNFVGVGYLSLSRGAKTLSGGEAQRIRLATQIGSALVDVIYVLDEPSIGLHPRDNSKLIFTLKRLRDQGNTVIVVEHDQETMESSDWIVDMGPGAGVHGGCVVAAGTYQEIKKNPVGITGAYLRKDLEISVPKKRRPIDLKKIISVCGASKNNLKSVSASFPLGTLICVTGVSGSGKSTLVFDTLYRALMHELFELPKENLRVDSILGTELIDKVIDIDQKPIGKTPRSNPATYTGLFTIIRDIFAQLPEAQIKGYDKGKFSFNVSGGRCDRCEGAGVTTIEMHFLPDVYIECESCFGKRYKDEVLEVKYKGKNISEVLSLSISEALVFFSAVPSLRTRLNLLTEVGLGYLELGQNATTLSGGEAQRVKLAKELARASTGKTLYLLDEPTTGLHFDDIQKLIQILHRLVDLGNTVVVVEHNLDLIKTADYILDLGPEAGEGGGTLVAFGTPESLIKNLKSHTGKYLKPYL
jgi:excinuclease ABC subunit A